MQNLDQERKISKDTSFRSNKNMTTTYSSAVSVAENEVNNSILRGELLRFAVVIPEVNEYLKDLKTSNSNYLKLLNQIVKVSIDSNTVDIDMCDSSSGCSILDSLLKQYNFASYNNTELLDFTQEVLNVTDNLTSKYYLAHLAAGNILNQKLKAQFKAAVPFVKYLADATLSSDSLDFTSQMNFMAGVKLIVNEKADVNKIALLSKIKQIIDQNSKNDHSIDIVKFIYSKAPLATINMKIKTLPDAIYRAEKSEETFDCVDYLIQNSL